MSKVWSCGTLRRFGLAQMSELIFFFGYCIHTLMRYPASSYISACILLINPTSLRIHRPRPPFMCRLWTAAAVLWLSPTNIIRDSRRSLVPSLPRSVGRSRLLQSVGRGGRSASHSRLRSRPSSERARADDDSPTLIATLPPREHHATDDVDTPNDFETRLTPPSSRVVAHPGRLCMYCSPTC